MGKGRPSSGTGEIDRSLYDESVELEAEYGGPSCSSASPECEDWSGDATSPCRRSAGDVSEVDGLVLLQRFCQRLQTEATDLFDMTSAVALAEAELGALRAELAQQESLQVTDRQLSGMKELLGHLLAENHRLGQQVKALNTFRTEKIVAEAKLKELEDFTARLQLENHTLKALLQVGPTADLNSTLGSSASLVVQSPTQTSGCSPLPPGLLQPISPLVSRESSFQVLSPASPAVDISESLRSIGIVAEEPIRTELGEGPTGPSSPAAANLEVCSRRSSEVTLHPAQSAAVSSRPKSAARERGLPHLESLPGDARTPAPGAPSCSELEVSGTSVLSWPTSLGTHSAQVPPASSSTRSALGSSGPLLARTLPPRGPPPELPPLNLPALPLELSGSPCQPEVAAVAPAQPLLQEALAEIRHLRETVAYLQKEMAAAADAQQAALLEENSRLRRVALTALQEMPEQCPAPAPPAVKEAPLQETFPSPSSTFSLGRQPRGLTSSMLRLPDRNWLEAPAMDGGKFRAKLQEDLERRAFHLELPEEPPEGDCHQEDFESALFKEDYESAVGFAGLRQLRRGLSQPQRQAPGTVPSLGCSARWCPRGARQRGQWGFTPEPSAMNTGSRWGGAGRPRSAASSHSAPSASKRGTQNLDLNGALRRPFDEWILPTKGGLSPEGALVLEEPSRPVICRAEWSRPEASAASKRPKGPFQEDPLQAAELMDLCSRARCLEENGVPEAAEKLRYEALAKVEEMVGKGHPRYFHCLVSLASNLGQQEKLQQAQEMLCQAYRGFADKLGPMHQSTLEAASLLGTCLAEMGGRDSEAEAMLRVALEGSQAKDGTGLRKFAEALASFLRERDRPHEAGLLLSLHSRP